MATCADSEPDLEPEPEDEMECVESYGQESVVKDHCRWSEEVSTVVSVAAFKAQGLAQGGELIVVRECPSPTPESLQDRVSQDQEMEEPEEDSEITVTAEDMGVALEEFQQIGENCSVLQLLPASGVEPILKLKANELPKDSQLQSIKTPDSVKEYMERRGLGVSVRVVSSTPSLPSDEEDPGPLVPTSEVVLSVLVFHPIKRRRDLEYLVLGSQCLTELRDKILCITDYFINQDYSECPDAFDRRSMEKGPPQPSRSAFFFINNTFYNDRRHPLSIDYSKVITDWAQEGNRIPMSPRLDTFRTADMASTSFEQLSFRMGYPYLYCHHGNCEHLIVFKDLRMLHTTDNQYKKDYPRLMYQHRGRRRKCHVCEIFGPTWVTYNDSLAPESPCYFCEDCFRKLHYSKDGKKICNFQAYPYHPAIII